MDIQSLIHFRNRKDETFAGHNSPLDPKERAAFTGPSYYEPNPSLIFHLSIHPTGRTRVAVQTSDGAQRVHERAGVVRFDVEAQEVSLVLYDTGHPGYFVPYRDATSGDETYGAGRYLDIDPNPDGTVTIDFNLAYNPLCAYSDAFSCPLPPVENWLAVPIRAGERDFTK